MVDHAVTDSVSSPNEGQREAFDAPSARVLLLRSRVRERRGSQRAGGALTGGRPRTVARTATTDERPVGRFERDEEGSLVPLAGGPTAVCRHTASAVVAGRAGGEAP